MDFDYSFGRIGAHWRAPAQITCTTRLRFQGVEYGRSLDEAATLHLVARCNSGTLDLIGYAG